jgi:hypothetical protein
MVALNWIGPFGRDHRVVMPSEQAHNLLAIMSLSNVAAWISRP